MSIVRSRFRRSVRKVPTEVCAINALWLALLLGASLIWPMGQGYDELTHADMAYEYAHNPFEFYGPGELTVSTAMVNMQGEMGGHIPPKEALADEPVPKRADRPSFTELGGNTRRANGTPNQMVQHPPLAYWVYAAVLRAPAVSSLSWDVQIWLLRLVGVVLVLPLPILAWAASRRLLGADGLISPQLEHLALVAAALPLTMPNLVRTSASVNGDVLLLASCSVLLYLLIRVMTGDLRRRVAVGVSVCLAIAILTKGFALVLPPVVLAAYLIGGRRRRDRGRALVSLAISAAGAAVAGLWWIRNLLVYGRIQSSGYGEQFILQRWGMPGDGDDGRLSEFLGPFLTKFIERTWGGIGLADQLTPGAPIVYGWFALSAVAVAAALVVRPGSGAPCARLRSWVLAAAMILTVVVVANGSLEFWRRKAVGPVAAQGRYIYHLVVAMAALVSVGCARVLRPEVVRRLALLVLTGGLVTQLLSWLAILRGWYGSDGGLRSGAGALLRWSPVPAEVTLSLAAVLPFALGVSTLAILLVSSRGATGRRGRSPRMASSPW